MKYIPAIFLIGIVVMAFLAILFKIQEVQLPIIQYFKY